MTKTTSYALVDDVTGRVLNQADDQELLECEADALYALGQVTRIREAGNRGILLTVRLDTVAAGLLDYIRGARPANHRASDRAIVEAALWKLWARGGALR